MGGGGTHRYRQRQVDAAVTALSKLFDEECLHMLVVRDKSLAHARAVLMNHLWLPIYRVLLLFV